MSDVPIRLGTQGWSYPDWIGSFYPPGSRQEDYLPFYAEVFDTVELDTTFYHPPKPSVVRSWARHTPETFRFAAKVPQAITHTARLASVGEQLQEFARALPLLETVAANQPEDDQIHFLLAQTWRGLSKPEAAAKEMQLHQQVLRRLAEGSPNQ